MIKCQKWIETYKRATEEKAGFVKNGGKSFVCKEDFCDRDMFLFDMPDYTLNVMKSILKTDN